MGLRRFLVGLGKKVILADNFALLIRLFRQSGETSVLFYWMYAVAFALNIYFDFSGYSDMAIGLGRVLGFHFVENFNYPYLSGSVTEFWRRWHISLGSWFRDYVYIPMGRQPGQPLAVGSEHPHRVDAYGAVARRGVEFRAVGAAVCRASAGGKVDSRPGKGCRASCAMAMCCWR